MRFPNPRPRARPGGGLLAGVTVGSLLYGTAIPASYTVVADATMREIVNIGDSRMAGSRYGTTPCQINSTLGAFGYIDNETYERAVFGETINAQQNDMQAAVASGAGIINILVGTNGSGGVAPDSGAERIAETLALLAIADVPTTQVIFISNEIPGANGSYPTGTDLEKVEHHAWLSTLTKASAGLTHPDLVVVDTWSALADNTAHDETTSILPQFSGDGLHQTNQGSDVIAQQWAAAVQTYFGNSVLLDFDSPTEDMMTGTQVSSLGDIPSKWSVPVSATGVSTALADGVLTISNDGSGGGEYATQDLWFVMDQAPSDGMWFLEYELDADGDAADTLQDNNTGLQITIDDAGFGNLDVAGGADEDLIIHQPDATSTRTQHNRMGGLRQFTFRIGESASPDRVRMSMRIKSGGELRITRCAIYDQDA